MATHDEPEPPPEAMSWERRISRPPELNDQTAALPFWVRPFAKPDVERRAASWPMSLVLARISLPYAFIVALVVNSMLGVPLRHMLFAVPATTIIGALLMLMAFGAVELIGWLSGYRPARASWSLDAEHTGDALGAALARSAVERGFVITWSKDHAFVATRNLESATRGFSRKPSEHMPLRLSLVPARGSAHACVLKLGVHATCFWEAGETALLNALARDLVSDAAGAEPWIAETARWKRSDGQ